jgi:excisionase family DNA binding protein
MIGLDRTTGAAMERWLTVQQICERLQVSDQTVRRWLKSGTLPGKNLGGKAGYRILESDLDAFMTRRDDAKTAA